MNTLLQNLVRLQSIQFEENSEKNAESAIAELRALIPAQILGHYDRMVAKGKKGIIPVRGQVCGGCHMSVPIGAITTLRRGEDIQLCENCGRYLYLPEPVQPETPPPAAPIKKARKPRAPKNVLVPV